MVSEVAWMEALAGVGEWFQPAGRTVLVVPHPDDEALAAGGLLASLAETRSELTVVAVTDGESAYTIGDHALGKVRRAEQIASLRRLGVAEHQVLRLSLPDSSVAAHEVELAERLVDIAGADGDEVTFVAPWVRDFHSDHEACGRAAKAAAKLTGSRLAWWFWWSWHQRNVAEVAALGVQKFALRPEWMRAKREALAEHRSQLGDGAILPDFLLAPARREFEVFAWAH